MIQKMNHFSVHSPYKIIAYTHWYAIIKKLVIFSIVFISFPRCWDPLYGFSNLNLEIHNDKKGK